MISAWSIRKFLMRQPRAAIVRLKSTGSPVQEIRPSRTSSLSKLSDTIFAVAPDLIELYDAEEKLIRAQKTDVEPDLSTDSPKTPAVLTSDPETARLSHFASLLAKAYEHSTTVAFAKLVELVERIDSRSDALEQRLERTEMSYRKVLYDQIAEAQREATLSGDDSEEDFGKQMLTTVVQGMAQGQFARDGGPKRPPSPNGSNGKG
jgi:hypothetical protein